jgi:hypothetical protein
MMWLQLEISNVVQACKIKDKLMKQAEVTYVQIRCFERKTRAIAP